MYVHCSVGMNVHCSVGMNVHCSVGVCRESMEGLLQVQHTYFHKPLGPGSEADFEECLKAHYSQCQGQCPAVSVRLCHCGVCSINVCNHNCVTVLYVAVTA